MAADTLATLLTKAGDYPQRFSKREARLAKIISDGLTPEDPDYIITTRGDLIRGNASGDAARLALGASGTVLKSDGTDPAWGAIVNADVSASAAIAYSKLNLATSIVNADVSASAAIAFSKLAALTSAQILVGNGSNVATAVAVSGDATLANTGALTIAANAVTASKISGSNGAKKVQRFTVGYAALNSAGTGVAALFGSALPDNAIVTRTWIDVTTTFAGNGDDGSTLKIGSEDQDNDVVAAVAISNGANPWDAGLHEGIQDGTAAAMVKLTAARQLAVTWTAAGTDTALAAGSMEVFVEYVEST